MSIGPTVNAAISKALAEPLAKALVEKFNLDRAEVDEFWKEFSAVHLKSKGARKGGKKGTNGKGRISGYILFSNDARPKVKAETPDASFKDMTQALSAKWRALSDKQKKKWNDKAAKQNAANGL